MLTFAELPAPSFGSYDLLGLSSDALFSRFSRFGQYGIGSENASPSTIKWEEVDWADLQRRCVARNQALFKSRPRPVWSAPTPEHQPYQEHQRAHSSENLAKTAYSGIYKERTPRTAVVMRAWDDFRWSQDDLLNIRAMMTELSFLSGGQYQLFIIMQVQNRSQALPARYESHEEIKKRYVPAEQLHITELCDKTDCEYAYPEVKEYEQV